MKNKFIFQEPVIISYCINTTKCWLLAIFKESELASWLKVFVVLHNDSLSRPSTYVVRQKFLVAKSVIILQRLFLDIKVKVNALHLYSLKLYSYIRTAVQLYNPTLQLQYGYIPTQYFPLSVLLEWKHSWTINACQQIVVICNPLSLRIWKLDTCQSVFT